jgi:outer membrane lipoprotein SlyB
MEALKPSGKLHPLLATAAVAVTVASVLGAIVLITDQVAAHRAPNPDAAAVASTKANTASPAPSAYSPPPAPTTARTAPVRTAAAAPPAPPPVCANCGIVAGVRALKTPGQGSGLGAAAGGAVGGLAGNQFGSGHGKTALTILGVIGGAVAGNEVEKDVKATTHYEVDVRLDNGQLRTVGVPGDPGPIVGMRVRIENGQLVRAAPPQS